MDTEYLEYAQFVPPMSLTKFAKISGMSTATIWRLRKADRLKTVNLNGRRYVTAAAIAEFNRRLEAGEFAVDAPHPKAQTGKRKR